VVIVESSDYIGEAEKIMDDAHKNCLISNSIKGKTIVEAEIKASS